MRGYLSHTARVIPHRVTWIQGRVRTCYSIGFNSIGIILGVMLDYELACILVRVRESVSFVLTISA